MVATTDAPDAPIQTVEVPCAVCGSERREKMAEGVDYFNHCSAQIFQMNLCLECGHVYLSPRPVDEELGRIYPEDEYYAYHLEEEAKKNSGNGLLSRLYSWRNERRLRFFKDFFGQSPGSALRILDLGCGDGTRLDYWKAVFPQAETHGLELSTRAAAIAQRRGHVVKSGRVEDVTFEPESFDVVTSSYLIEHVADPRAFLARCRQWVKPSGLVVISMPPTGSLDYHLFKRSSWGMHGFPCHWNLLSISNFNRLCSESNLEIVKIHYYPSAVSWIWSLHANLWKHSPALANRLFPMKQLFFRGSVYNFALLSFFTVWDYGAKALTGKTSDVTCILRARGSL